MKHLPFFLLAALVALPFSAEAARVKHWHHHRPADQDRAERKGVVQTASGAICLSRQLKPLAKLECGHVWAVVEDTAGALYAATGDEGKVYRISPNGKAAVAYEGDAAQVLSLAAMGEVVYAGTGPTARIVRIDGNGDKVLCELSRESYVWAIAADSKSDAIYAATGPHGRIYKVTAEGKASVFYETKQDHVLCLAVAADGTVFAGTDRTGRVLRIDATGKGFVMHQAAQAEVKCMMLTDDALIIGTSGTKKRGGGSGSAASSPSTAALIGKKPAVIAVSEKSEKASSTKKDSDSKDEKKGSPASAPSSPSSGENSVIRLAFDGGVREVFRNKVLVLALARQGKCILAGTGMAGQLFEIEENSREKCELARLDHGQITALWQRKDGGLVVATGDPGQLYLLDDRFASKGTLTSEVLDAKLSAKWGALRWRADVPAKTAVRVAVRSGNVSEVDETWSAWSEDETSADEAAITAPAARYLQYRVTLRSDDTSVTPTLKSLTLSYATANQAPELTKLVVPDLSAKTLDNPKKLKFEWSASDANEDELRYRLSVKKDGWENWILLEAEAEKTEYEWDTTTTPSGVYRLKVVASDHVDNPKSEALKAEKISEPFVVCHTPPEVKVKTTATLNGKVTLEASASSPLVRLTAASYTINGKKWSNVFPSDGLFDSRREQFAITTAALKPGTYVVVVKVQDAAGNTGSGDVVFTVAEE